jgi:hypothetical protein
VTADTFGCPSEVDLCGAARFGLTLPHSGLSREFETRGLIPYNHKSERNFRSRLPPSTWPCCSTQVLAYLTELLIGGTFFPKRRNTMWTSESLNWGDAGFLKHERAMRNLPLDTTRRRYREEQLFRCGQRIGEISAGLLLDFRLQMRCSGANESALMQTKQRKYRWAQTEPEF